MVDSHCKQCFYCTHADFKTPMTGGMKGFAHCTAEGNSKAHYLPKQQVCHNGRFQTASAETLAVRQERLGEPE